jgi:hypothetical protein
MENRNRQWRTKTGPPEITSGTTEPNLTITTAAKIGDKYIQTSDSITWVKTGATTWAVETGIINRTTTPVFQGILAVQTIGGITYIRKNLGLRYPTMNNNVFYWNDAANAYECNNFISAVDPLFYKVNGAVGVQDTLLVRSYTVSNTFPVVIKDFNLNTAV